MDNIPSCSDKTTDLEKTINSYKQIIEEEPENAQANYYLGIYSAEQGLHEKAIEHFKIAIEKNTLSEDSYINMAKSFLEIDENQLAINCLTKGHKINNDNYEIVYLLGFAYFLQADYDKAVKFFDSTIKLQNDYRNAYYFKAIALMRQNKNSKAIKALNLILNINPNDHSALYQKGLIYLNKKERKKAMILMNKAKEMGNEDAGLFF